MAHSWNAHIVQIACGFWVLINAPIERQGSIADRIARTFQSKSGCRIDPYTSKGWKAKALAGALDLCNWCRNRTQIELNLGLGSQCSRRLSQLETWALPDPDQSILVQDWLALDLLVLEWTARRCRCRWESVLSRRGCTSPQWVRWCDRTRCSWNSGISSVKIYCTILQHLDSGGFKLGQMSIEEPQWPKLMVAMLKC